MAADPHLTGYVSATAGDVHATTTTERDPTRQPQATAPAPRPTNLVGQLPYALPYFA